MKNAFTFFLCRVSTLQIYVRFMQRKSIKEIPTTVYGTSYSSAIAEHFLV